MLVRESVGGRVSGRHVITAAVPERLTCHIIVVDCWQRFPDWTAEDHLANLGGRATALGLDEHRLYTIRKWLRTLNAGQSITVPLG